MPRLCRLWWGRTQLPWAREGCMYILIPSRRRRRWKSSKLRYNQRARLRRWVTKLMMATKKSEEYEEEDTFDDSNNGTNNDENYSLGGKEVTTDRDITDGSG